MAKKQKRSGQPLLEAMQTFSDILDKHRVIKANKKYLADVFNSFNMSLESTIDDSWTLRDLCTRLTTNETDRLILLDRAFKENPNAALNMLKYNYYGRSGKETDEEKLALNALMDRPDDIFELIEADKKLSTSRINDLWDKHNVYWFKKHNLAPMKLEILCRTFRNKVEYEHLALMVKRFVGRKMDDHALRLQKDIDMNLPTDLKDQLEGCIMMKTLMKANK